MPSFIMNMTLEQKKKTAVLNEHTHSAMASFFPLMASVGQAELVPHHHTAQALRPMDQPLQVCLPATLNLVTSLQSGMDNCWA